MNIRNDLQKKGKYSGDLGTLTERELLEVFADRVLAYEETNSELHSWEKEYDWNDAYEADCEDEGASESDKQNLATHEKLKWANDENFCLVRECIRFIKGDNEILAC